MKARLLYFSDAHVSSDKICYLGESEGGGRLELELELGSELELEMGERSLAESNTLLQTVDKSAHEGRGGEGRGVYWPCTNPFEPCKLTVVLGCICASPSSNLCAHSPG